MTPCKEICKKLKVTPIFGVSMYAMGHKRGSRCRVYLLYKGNNCPCCGATLRSKAHHKGGYRPTVRYQEIKA